MESLQIDYTFYLIAFAIAELLESVGVSVGRRVFGLGSLIARVCFSFT